MLDKYIKIESEKFRYKQNSDGTWICTDLKANTIKESDLLISEVNKLLNKFNKQNGKERKVTPKKETNAIMPKSVRPMPPKGIL